MADPLDNTQPSGVSIGLPQPTAAQIAADNAVLDARRAGKLGLAPGPASGGAAEGSIGGKPGSVAIPSAAPNNTAAAIVPQPATTLAPIPGGSASPDATLSDATAGVGLPYAPPAPAAAPEDQDYPGAMTATGAAPTSTDVQDYPGAVSASSATSKLEQFGESTAKGFISTGGPIAGMTAGAALGTLGGPAAPVTVPVGAAIGLAAGYFGAKAVNDKLGISSPEQLPPDLRPYAYGGEAFGGALPMGGATVGAAKAGIRTSIPFVQKILDYAGKHPWAFMRTETAAAGASGMAGTGMDVVDPNDPKTRIPAEIVGGFLSPTRLVSSTVGGAFSAAKRAFSYMSSAGQTTLAGQRLRSILSGQFGEDPDVIAALLNKMELTDAAGKPVVGTSAQMTGSPALAALEHALSRESPKAGGELSKTAQSYINAMKKLIDALAATGDPAALAAAAVVRAKLFRAMISGRIQAAEQEATEAASKITKDTPETRQDLGILTAKLVQNALKDARAAEKELWDKVPTDVPSDAEGVIAAYKEISKDVPKEFGMPASIQSFVRRMEKGALDETEGDAAANAKLADAGFTVPPAEVMPGPAAKAPTTSGELKNFRTEMLDAARAARAAFQFNMARKFDAMADGALHDLNVAGEKSGADAYDAAREFSRDLNDIFSRTFASGARDVDRQGASRIAPEEYLDKAFGTGGTAADLRMKELQDATEFMQSKGLNSPEADKNVGLMLDAQDRIMRLGAAAAIDAQTGRVSTKALSSFMQRNSAILDRFPAAREAMEKALESEQSAKDTVAALNGQSQLAERESAFAKLEKVDSAVDAVSKVIRGQTPDTGLADMIELAKGDLAAQAGLRSAILQDAMDRAGGSGDFFSNLDDALNQPMRPGLPSVMDVMRKNGLIDTAEVGRLTQILKAGQLAEAAANAPAADVNRVQPTNALSNVALSIAGSKVGGKIAHALGDAQSLIARSAASHYFHTVFNGLGIDTMQKVLIQAAEDPSFMAALLKDPKSQAEAITNAMAIKAYLTRAGFSAGIQGVSGAVTNSEDEPAAEPAAPAQEDAPQSDDKAYPGATPPAETAPQPHADAAPGLLNSGAEALPLVRQLERSADDAVSKPKNPRLAPAIGRYQIQVQTAHDHGFPDATAAKLKDPAYNTQVATGILDHLIAEYHGDRDAVLAAYNGGRSAANRWLMNGRDNSQLGEETVKYLAHARQLASK